MESFSYFRKIKSKPFCKFSSSRLCCPYVSSKTIIESSFHILLFQVNPFWIELSYFTIISLFGFLALKASKPRNTATSSFKPSSLDIFFTSVSSTTVSSMSTVEMEFFSDTQLVIMTFLMFIGGEVFTSLLRLHFQRYIHKKDLIVTNTNPKELVVFSGSVGVEENEKPIEKNDLESNNNNSNLNNSLCSDGLKYDSVIKSLSHVVLGFLVVVHLLGIALVALYISIVSSAREVLKKKGIHLQTFAFFTAVSTFVNAGYVPTNENMIVFKKNSGLLLLLIPQTLLGNTLCAPSLRFVIWVLEKITKKVEYRYILRNNTEIGYSHLLSGVHCWCLVGTVLGFIVIQFVLFCSMEWNSKVMDGLSAFEKVIGALFLVVNARHAGESAFDISLISPAILVLFVVMMYLPPYFSFIPTKLQTEVPKGGKESRSHGKTVVDCLLFSQLTYPVIFIILICIVERERMKTDPLNFNVLNITLEVISAYGNVGFSTGYSCERQMKAESSCKDAWYGFAGKWSNLAKFILIIVMFFGRLKKYSTDVGKAWKIT